MPSSTLRKLQLNSQHLQKILLTEKLKYGYNILRYLQRTLDKKSNLFQTTLMIARVLQFFFITINIVVKQCQVFSRLALTANGTILKTRQYSELEDSFSH